MRTVHLCHPTEGNSLMILDRPGSTRSTHVAVEGVPDDVSNSEVILRVSGIIIWPWPTEPVPWSHVAELPQGAILRGL